MVQLFTCAVLQLLYFWLLLFTPCLEPLLLIGIADLNGCCTGSTSTVIFNLIWRCVRLGDWRLISTCTEEFRGTWAGGGARSGKWSPCPAPPREASVPREVGDTPSSQPKISVWVLLPRATRHKMRWIIEHFGVKTCGMFRARTKDRERKGSRRYANEQVWENSGMRR